MIFVTDAYNSNPPRSRRQALEERVRALRVALWSSPGDRDAREALEAAEEALRALDAGLDRGGGRG